MAQHLSHRSHCSLFFPSPCPGRTWNPAAAWALAGEIASDSMAQHSAVWGEGGGCCLERDQITTCLAHFFHECSHGWVSTETGSTSTLLACVLCRIAHIFSAASWGPLPSDSLAWQRQMSAQPADCSCAWAVELLLLQFSVQGMGGRLWNFETYTESALQVLGKCWGWSHKCQLMCVWHS